MDAISRVRELKSEGKTGKEIAQVLHDESYTINEARDALYQEHYVVSIQPFIADLSELHVSNHPMESGIVAIIASSEPRALPSVVWK